MVIVMWTTHEILTLIKVWLDILFYLTEQSSFGVCKVIKQLHCLLQKLNIKKSWRYVSKNYFSVQFYCLWEFLKYPITMHVDNVGDLS